MQILVIPEEDKVWQGNIVQDNLKLKEMNIYLKCGL